MFTITRNLRRYVAAFLISLMMSLFQAKAFAEGKVIYPEYESPKVVVEFFFGHPEKINTALFWIRSLMVPLMEEPYNMAPEFMDIIVVIHGTEIATTVEHNYERYRDAVERMRYYHSLGVKFRVCAIAATQYQYSPKDFYDFIEIAPSAMTEIVHWQQQGYSLLIPQVFIRTESIEGTR